MNKVLIPVKGHDDLVRDPVSKAILNIDREALEEHRKKRRLFQSVTTSEERLNKLESDMGDIKDTLSTILNLIKENK